MSMFPDSRPKPFELDYGTDERHVYNFFNAVYAWMCVGLAVTATVAWLVAQNTSLVVAINQRGVIVPLFLGLALLAWGIRANITRMSTAVAIGLFLLYAAVIGAALSYIFLIYNITVIGGAFLMTAGTFGVMSLYGYFTKRDLTRIGSVLVMLAIGLFFASLVNILFIRSGPMSWFITYAVLVVFVGLTAAHTQMLKTMATETQGDPRLAARLAIIGSLTLYVDFINIFVSLLRILGSRK